jgi:hypothetical protein
MPWKRSPPGYVTRMVSRSYLPLQVKTEVRSPNGLLDATALRSEDGQRLVIQAVYPGNQPRATKIRLAGFQRAQPIVRIEQLDGPLDAVNTAANPGRITRRQIEWRPDLKDGGATYVFPPHSFSVMRWE